MFSFSFLDKEKKMIGASALQKSRTVKDDSEKNVLHKLMTFYGIVGFLLPLITSG